jgi:hypothetical protein
MSQNIFSLKFIYFLTIFLSMDTTQAYVFAIMPNSRHNYMCTEFTTTNRTFYRFVKVEFGLFLFSSFFLNSLRKLLLLSFFSYIKTWYVLFTVDLIFITLVLYTHIYTNDRNKTHIV